MPYSASNTCQAVVPLDSMATSQATASPSAGVLQPYNAVGTARAMSTYRDQPAMAQATSSAQTQLQGFGLPPSHTATQPAGSPTNNVSPVPSKTRFETDAAKFGLPTWRLRVKQGLKFHMGTLPGGFKTNTKTVASKHRLIKGLKYDKTPVAHSTRVSSQAEHFAVGSKRFRKRSDEGGNDDPAGLAGSLRSMRLNPVRPRATGAGSQSQYNQPAKYLPPERMRHDREHVQEITGLLKRQNELEKRVEAAEKRVEAAEQREEDKPRRIAKLRGAVPQIVPHFGAPTQASRAQSYSFTETVTTLTSSASGQRPTRARAGIAFRSSFKSVTRVAHMSSQSNFSVQSGR